MKLNVNGVNYYIEWFSTYDANRPTLLCLHGFTGTSQTFSTVFPEERTYNILSIDLIGHGKTDVWVHPYRYQIGSLCQDIITLMKQLGIEQFAVVGYSMGARVAVALACLFQINVKQLIIESGSLGIQNNFERYQRQQADQHLAEYLMSHTLEDFVKKWEQMSLFTTQKKLPLQVQQKIRLERLSQQRFGLACSLWFMGSGAQPSFFDYLPLLNLPILLIVGEHDDKFIRIARAMKQQQPTALIKVVKEAGHCIHLEKTSEFTSICTSFLQGEKLYDD